MQSSVMHAKMALLAALVALCFTGCASIRVQHVGVPAAVARGDAAELSCEWSLEGDTLSTLKWYRGEVEFYRWTPRNEPNAQQKFPIEEKFDVDLQKSHEGKVHIKNVSAGAGGAFRCEVSGEAPTFATHAQQKPMDVVEVPAVGPVLNLHMRGGHGGPLRLGDDVRANCSSLGRPPPPDFNFLINKEKVAPHRIIQGSWAGGSWATYDLRVTSGLVPEDGVVEVMCAMSHDDVYFKTAAKYIYLEEQDGLSRRSYLADTSYNHALPIQHNKLFCAISIIILHALFT